jgi:hypothetical protein
VCGWLWSPLSPCRPCPPADKDAADPFLPHRIPIEAVGQWGSGKKPCVTAGGRFTSTHACAMLMTAGTNRGRPRTTTQTVCLGPAVTHHGALPHLGQARSVNGSRSGSGSPPHAAARATQGASNSYTASAAQSQLGTPAAVPGPTQCTRGGVVPHAKTQRTHPHKHRGRGWPGPGTRGWPRTSPTVRTPTRSQCKA